MPPISGRSPRTRAHPRYVRRRRRNRRHHCLSLFPCESLTQCALATARTHTHTHDNKNNT